MEKQGIVKCTDCKLFKEANRILRAGGKVRITDNEQFKKWSTGFSARVLILITGCWAVMNAYVLLLVTIQFFRLSILDSELLRLFIEKNNEVFLASVVSILITRVVGNVFEFNNGGIFGVSKDIGAPAYENPEEEING